MLAKSGLVVLGHGLRQRGDFYPLCYAHNLIPMPMCMNLFSRVQQCVLLQLESN